MVMHSNNIQEVEGLNLRGGQQHWITLFAQVYVERNISIEGFFLELFMTNHKELNFSGTYFSTYILRLLIYCWFFGVLEFPSFENLELQLSKV